MYACKRFLYVSKMSCNDAVSGDLGRYPIYVFAAKRCIKYWLRLYKCLIQDMHVYVIIC